MKNFCTDLREHATKIKNYEKKEMIPLTKKEEEMHNKQNICCIYVKQNLVPMMAKKKKIL